MQHPISLVAPPEMEVDEGERVTVRISSRRPVRAKLTDDPLPGMSVDRADLSAALGREDAGVRIAASRYGDPVSATDVPDLAGRVEDGMTVAFGAPERGLPAMTGIDVGPDASGDGSAESRGTDDGTAGSESGPNGSTEDPFDLWLNTIPDQGSEVVRTEEAMFATLAILSLKH